MESARKIESARKYSKKRNAIYKALCDTKTHPNAEWIHQGLKAEYPDLSLGTVYRNLALFKESGDINCVASVKGQERFDGNTAPHAHFICTECGDVADLMEEKQPSFPKTAGRVDGYQLNFYGLCVKCCKKSVETPVNNI